MIKEKLEMLVSELPHDSVVRLMSEIADTLESVDADKFNVLLERFATTDRYSEYLSEEEAQMIVDSMVNYDGTSGGKWGDSVVLFRKVKEVGGEIEREGMYNRWALFAAMNMIYSDYGGVIRSVVDGDRFVKMTYNMAVAFLCDRDKGEKTIRWYFQVE